MTGAARRSIVEYGRVLAEAGLCPGTTGNLSVRTGASMVVTPTGARLGALEEDSLSVLDLDGVHTSGPQPTKEAFLHAALYRARPDVHAIVHVHAPWTLAASCRSDLDTVNSLPNYTPYYVMRVGQLERVPYFPPGDLQLAEAVASAVTRADSLLLAQHGSITFGADLDEAVSAASELEANAALHFALQGAPIAVLNDEEVAVLNARYPRQVSVVRDLSAG